MSSTAAVPVDDPELARDSVIALDAARSYAGASSDTPLDTAAIAPDSSVYRDFEVPQKPSKPSREVSVDAVRPACSPGKAKTARKAKPSRPRAVDIPAGCFRMGSPDGLGAANEHPRHQVCLDSFRIDRLPVSQREFAKATGQTPWTLCDGPACAGPDLASPAWFVTWTEADDFCHTRHGRLPTEAEYEYAARAGDSGTYIWGDSVSDACRYANFADLSLKRILPAWKTFPCEDGEPLVARSGTRSPNRWGLYDMAGNVWEWAQDWYAADAYAKSALRNPTGPDSGSGRVIRGGSWLSGPDGGRAAYRDGFQPDGRYTGSIGFRCVYPAH
jgi:formylglycine-generating enzyme required for sulfatase activity